MENWTNQNGRDVLEQYGNDGFYPATAIPAKNPLNQSEGTVFFVKEIE
jgi:hypothetical protein